MRAPWGKLRHAKRAGSTVTCVGLPWGLLPSLLILGLLLQRGSARRWGSEAAAGCTQGTPVTPKPPRADGRARLSHRRAGAAGYGPGCGGVLDPQAGLEAFAPSFASVKSLPGGAGGSQPGLAAHHHPPGAVPRPPPRRHLPPGRGCRQPLSSSSSSRRCSAWPAASRPSGCGGARWPGSTRRSPGVPPSPGAGTAPVVPPPVPPQYSVGVMQPHTPPLPPEASASPSQARRLRGRGDAIGETLRKGPHCRGGQEAGGQVRPPGAGTPATCCPRLHSVSDSRGDGDGHRTGCHRTPGTPDTPARGSCPPGLSLPHPEPRGLVAVQKVPGDPEPPAAGGLQGRLPGPAGGIHGAARGGPHRTAEAEGDGGGDGPAAPARHERDGGSLGGHRLWAPCVLRAALGVMSWAVSAGTGDEPGGGGGTGGDVQTPRILQLRDTSRAQSHRAAARKLTSISRLHPGRGFHSVA